MLAGWPVFQLCQKCMHWTLCLLLIAFCKIVEDIQLDKILSSIKDCFHMVVICLKNIYREYMVQNSENTQTLNICQWENMQNQFIRSLLSFWPFICTTSNLQWYKIISRTISYNDWLRSITINHTNWTIHVTMVTFVQMLILSTLFPLL